MTGVQTCALPILPNAQIRCHATPCSNCVHGLSIYPATLFSPHSAELTGHWAPSRTSSRAFSYRFRKSPNRPRFQATPSCAFVLETEALLEGIEIQYEKPQDAFPNAALNAKEAPASRWSALKPGVQGGLHWGKVLGQRHLEVVARSLEAAHTAAHALDQGRIISAHKARAIGPLIRAAQGIGPEHLRGLDRPELSARRSFDKTPSCIDDLEGIDRGLAAHDAIECMKVIGGRYGANRCVLAPSRTGRITMECAVCSKLAFARNVPTRVAEMCIRDRLRGAKRAPHPLRQAHHRRS